MTRSRERNKGKIGKENVHPMSCGEMTCYNSSTDVKTYSQIHETSQTHMN